MYDVAIFFEHVDLFNGLDRLDIKLFQTGLQLFVVRTRGLVDLFGLATWCTFATTNQRFHISDKVRQKLGMGIVNCEDRLATRR